MILWLPEPIRVDTPLGKGYVLFVETANDDYWWTIALDNCAIVTFNQSRIKIGRNYTLNRSLYDEEMVEIMAKVNKSHKSKVEESGSIVVSQQLLNALKNLIKVLDIANRSV